MDYLSTNVRINGLFRMTIENGYGIKMSVEIPTDSPMDEQMEAVTRLLYGSGWMLSHIRDRMRDEAERIDNEINNMESVGNGTGAY